MTFLPSQSPDLRIISAGCSAVLNTVYQRKDCIHYLCPGGEVNFFGGGSIIFGDFQEAG